MEKVKEKKVKIPRSYGMLVFREAPIRGGGSQREFLIVRPSQGIRKGEENTNPYYLPKGGAEPDESAADAAYREVLEETGIRAKILSPLGTVKYRSGRKEIILFLAQYKGGTITDDGRCLQHDWENDDVRFVNEFDAKRMLRYEFREMINVANKLLDEVQPLEKHGDMEEWKTRQAQTLVVP